jgi:nucleotide-binding universal stress UspA family protein
MIEIRRILCPVDFSDSSRRAVDQAMAIARWYGASVTALHVFPMPPVAAAPTGPIILEPVLLTAEMRQQLLASVRQMLATETAPGVATDAVLGEGAPAAGILDQARRMNADLIVIGTHGRSGFDRILLGSVTERVLRKATCPVVTVPPAAPDAVPAATVLYKNIVCPVDFSDASMRALDYAFSMAREADAKLTVLHVTPHEFDLPLEDAGGDAALTVSEFFERRERQARERLDQAVHPRAQDYCTAVALVTRAHRPWQEILRVAGERHADLIVMGVQGRGAVDLMFFGSTTQQVVRQASCPVLTLRGTPHPAETTRVSATVVSSVPAASRT